MSYIGNSLPANFQSLPAVQRFNGDGSDTTFTLAAQIANDQSILVSVDGVTQDSNAYSVSGTTLTFTAAPSAGTGNIFVNTISPVGSTITHPASDPLSASTGAFSGKITADAGIDIDNINIDGTTIALSSGDLIVDVAGGIVLDADDSGTVSLKDAGTRFGILQKSGNNFEIQSAISDGDIVFKGTDGGSGINALTLDMSAAGEATFNSSVNATALDAATSSGVSIISATASGSCNLVLGTNFSGGTSQGMPNQSGFINMRQSFPIVFGTAEAERMRIASDGAVHIRSTATPSSSVSGFMFSSDQFYTSAGNTTNANTQIRFINGNGLVGNVTVSGSSTAFNTSSDYRLKENVDYTWDATTRLKQLKPARFNFKVDADTTVDGFLAHEAQAVVPECVTGTKDEVDGDGVAVMQGIDQSKLVPLLVKALQEQQAVIESLTTRITALEAE